jgi:hypothetical protein
MVGEETFLPGYISRSRSFELGWDARDSYFRTSVFLVRLDELPRDQHARHPEETCLYHAVLRLAVPVHEHFLGATDLLVGGIRDSVSTAASDTCRTFRAGWAAGCPVESKRAETSARFEDSLRFGHLRNGPVTTAPYSRMVKLPERSRSAWQAHR